MAANIVNILLQRPSPSVPWGFRIQGGADTGHPVFIQRVTPGTISSRRLEPGDIILQIRGKPTKPMNHLDATDELNLQSSTIELTVHKRIPARYDTYEDLEAINYGMGMSNSPNVQRTPPSSANGTSIPIWTSSPVSNKRNSQPRTPSTAPAMAGKAWFNSNNPSAQQMPPKNSTPSPEVWQQNPGSRNTPSSGAGYSQQSHPLHSHNQISLPGNAAPSRNSPTTETPPINRIQDGSEQSTYSPPGKLTKGGPAGGIAVFPGMPSNPRQEISPATDTGSSQTTSGPPSGAPPTMLAVPPPPAPPPPAPPPPAQTEKIPWKDYQKMTSGAVKHDAADQEQPSGTGGVYHPSQHCAQKPGEGADKPFCYFPPELSNTLQKKDKKPFTYTPTGLDLSQIRSSKLHKRLEDNVSDMYAVQSSDDKEEDRNVKPSEVLAAVNHSRPTQVLPSPGTAQMIPPPPPPKKLSSPNAARRNDDFTPPIGYHKQQPSPPTTKMQRMSLDANARPHGQHRMSPGQGHQYTNRGSNEAHPVGTSQGSYQNNGSAQAFCPPSPYYDGGEHGESYDDDQINPRYRGGNIPSRSFKMLQTMTGISNNEDTAPPIPRKKVINKGKDLTPDQGRPIYSMPPSQQEAEAEPRMYSGGSIPSRSFRMLQHMTGEDPPGEGVTDF